MSKRISFRPHDLDGLLRDVPRCSYCDSLEHGISSCALYEADFDFTNKSKIDPEQDMVFARRKAIRMGGIPEQYLSSPSDEQKAEVARNLARQRNVLEASIRLIEESFRKQVRK